MVGSAAVVKRRQGCAYRSIPVGVEEIAPPVTGIDADGHVNCRRGLERRRALPADSRETSASPGQAWGRPQVQSAAATGGEPHEQISSGFTVSNYSQIMLRVTEGGWSTAVPVSLDPTGRSVFMATPPAPRASSGKNQRKPRRLNVIAHFPAVAPSCTATQAPQRLPV